jgi:glycosyltransferase involved in cell wall biosynthesis
MPRKTVCIDCRYIRERPSGIATIVQALVDHLPTLAPDLDFYFLKHPHAPKRLSEAPNVRETVVTFEANGPGTLFALPHLVDLRGVDLFHSTFNILPHGLRMPSVVTLCDVMWIKYPHWARSPGVWGHVETLFYQHGIRNALRNATRLVAISQATKSEIGSVDRAAEQRTRVALEGIDSDFRPPAGEDGARRVAAARQKHLPNVGRYVLSVGQFAPYKNHLTVVRAFARAFRDDPSTHLAIVQRLGAGPQALGPLAKELGVGDRVHFLHGVPRDELVAIFNGALMLCHPSLYEGFGNCPAEAMAAGCPVVTSNRSSMPEVSGAAAELVDPDSVGSVAAGLAKVAADEALRASMRARGLARAAELTWRAHAEGNLAAYREIVG